MQIHGRCHCGSITFTGEVDPAKVFACHCADCQKMSGAPFRAVVPIPAKDFSLTGNPKIYIKTAQSGNRRAQASRRGQWQSGARSCDDCAGEVSTLVRWI